MKRKFIDRIEVFRAGNDDGRYRNLDGLQVDRMDNDKKRTVSGNLINTR